MVKLSLSICGVLGILLGIAQAQNVPAYVPTTNLVAYYGFNNSPADLSGSNNNGVITGGVVAAPDRNGNPASAYDFTSPTALITVASPSFAFSANGSFTYSLWMKTNEFVGNAMMMGSTAAGNFISLISSGASVSFGTNKQQSAWFWAATPNVIGVWTHYVAVYNAPNMTLYKNGVQVASNVFTYTNVTTATLPLYIGRGIQAPYMNGFLDEIGIWSRALSVAEIQQLYNGCSLDITTNPTSTTTPIGSSAQFTINTVGNPTNLQWQVNTGTGFTNVINNSVYNGANTNTLTISNASFAYHNYLFRCYISDSVCSDTSTSSALVMNCVGIIGNNLPAQQIFGGGSNNNLAVSSPDINAQFQWQKRNSANVFVNLTNAGNISGSNTDSLKFSAIQGSNAGFYRCLVSVGNCVDSTSIVEVLVTPGVNVSNLEKSVFSVYPNPSKKDFLVQIDESAIGKSYSFYNVEGKLVNVGLITETNMLLDCTKLQRGIYFFEIKDSGQKPVKLILQ